MNLDPSHSITVCLSCKKSSGGEDAPGYDLIERLRRALADTRDIGAEPYTVGGVACMAGCDRPCTVAFQCGGKASYLFGDIDPDADIDDLMRFARQYALLRDGWCSSVDRPGKLRKSTLARIPGVAPAHPLGPVL